MHAALIGLTATLAGITGYLSVGASAPAAPPIAMAQPVAPSAQQYMTGPLAETMVNLGAGSTIADLGELLRDQTGLAVYIHTDRLGEAGLDATTQIRTPVLGVPLERAMTLINESFGNEFDRVAVARTGELIEISLLRHFDERNIELTSYDVWDILHSTDPDPEVRSAAHDRKRSELVELISSMIEPDSWVDFGGDLASLRFAGDKLFVRAPSRYQTQVAWILERLRDDDELATAPAAPEAEAAADHTAGRTTIQASEDGGVSLRIERDGQDPVTLTSSRIVLDHAVDGSSTRFLDGDGTIAGPKAPARPGSVR